MTRFKFATIVLMLVAAFSSALAQDAKGWFEENCDGATFHFTKIAGRRNDQRLEFFFRTGFIHFNLYPTGPEWHDVYGKPCPATGKCEDVVTAANAKMQFQEHKGRIVSGKYTIDLPGGHLEGQFRVKERSLKHPSRLCL
jgi:hypothetical protein